MMNTSGKIVLWRQCGQKSSTGKPPFTADEHFFLFEALGQREHHSFESRKKEVFDNMRMMVTEGGQKYE